MKRIIKYLLLLLLIALVGYRSVYFRRLSEIQNHSKERFDAASFSKRLWEERLPGRLDSAAALSELFTAIRSAPEEAFSKYSNFLGIGNYRYCLVKTVARVIRINDDEIMVRAEGGDSSYILNLATEFIYGNAIRDASGLVDIREISNSPDLNSISEELNRLVRTTVIPAFKQMVKEQDRIEMTGAIEFNREHIVFDSLEFIPVRLNILK